MTTEQAFEEMINTRGIYHKLGVTASTVVNTRFQYNNNINGISLDKKIRFLKEAGYKLVQDMKWQPPK